MTTSRRILRSIGPLQAGKLGGLLYAILGAFMMPVGLGIFLLDSKHRVAGLIFLAAPLFYGVIGFGTGVVFAYLYNFLAARVGGLELEVEEPESAQGGAEPQDR